VGHRLLVGSCGLPGWFWYAKEGDSAGGGSFLGCWCWAGPWAREGPAFAAHGPARLACQRHFGNRVGWPPGALIFYGQRRRLPAVGLWFYWFSFVHATGRGRRNPSPRRVGSPDGFFQYPLAGIVMEAVSSPEALPAWPAFLARRIFQALGTRGIALCGFLLLALGIGPRLGGVRKGPLGTQGNSGLPWAVFIALAVASLSTAGFSWAKMCYGFTGGPSPPGIPGGAARRLSGGPSLVGVGAHLH